MELISPFSLCVLSLEALHLTKTALAPATGFLLEAAGRRFIVTNYHVLAGRHPYTEIIPESSEGLIPEFLRVKYRVFPSGNGLPDTVEIDHPLYDEDRNPLYYALAPAERRLPVEPNGVKLSIDVAILEVRDIPQKSGVLKFERPTEFLIPVLEQVAIIGYPHNLSGTENFPIWLSGTVASDLANRPQRRCFFVDARSRGGCSGSLVIFRTRGASMQFPGGVSDRHGNIFYTVGIYSGRITEDSDIGIVWHWNTLEETLEKVIPLKDQDWKRIEERTDFACRIRPA